MLSAPGLLGDQRGRDGIGIARAARLTQRRDVIDVHAEVNRCRALILLRLQSAAHDVLQNEPALSGRSPR